MKDPHKGHIRSPHPLWGEQRICLDAWAKCFGSWLSWNSHHSRAGAHHNPSDWPAGNPPNLENTGDSDGQLWSVTFTFLWPKDMKLQTHNLPLHCANKMHPPGKPPGKPQSCNVLAFQGPRHHMKCEFSPHNPPSQVLSLPSERRKGGFREDKLQVMKPRFKPTQLNTTWSHEKRN